MRLDFSLTLVSSAGENLTAAGGVTNTLVNFTNEINLTEQNIRKGDWEMCMSSFYIHDEFEDYHSNTHVKAYRVETNIINVWPNVHSTALAIVPRKHRQKNSKLRGLYYEPINPEYYPLLTTQCSSIQIQITPIDKHGSPIKANLLAGQPTILKLHFKNTMYDDTTIRVLKIQSAEPRSIYFPTNTCVEFATEAQAYLALTPKANVEYSCALNSITYLPAFTEGGRQSGPNKLMLVDAATQTVLKEHSIRPLSEIELSSPDEFLVYANTELGEVDGNLIFGVNPATNKLKLINGTTKAITLRLPMYFIYNLGLRNFKQPNVTLLTDEQLDITLQPNAEMPFDTTFKANAYTPEVGFIYCDFVESSQVGNTMSPILGSFPIKDFNQNKYVTFATKNHEWYPLAKFDLSHMKFSLRDVRGQLLPFKNKKANLIMSVLIKRRDF